MMMMMMTSSAGSRESWRVAVRNQSVRRVRYHEWAFSMPTDPEARKIVESYEV
jgi:hypothetical protein